MLTEAGRVKDIALSVLFISLNTDLGPTLWLIFWDVARMIFLSLMLAESGCFLPTSSWVEAIKVYLVFHRTL